MTAAAVSVTLPTLLVIGRTRVNGLVYGSYVRLQRGLWVGMGLVLAGCVAGVNAIGDDKTGGFVGVGSGSGLVLQGFCGVGVLSGGRGQNSRGWNWA